ncbi:MAG: DUF899 domain-containing protein [Woeseiaceae bacterium]|nr:DUF899 domain-containing protein [Woeseiaceae bacterium]
MNRIVSDADWLAARKQLLEEEKAFQAARDELAQKRRALPWRKIDEDYGFETESGHKTLAGLFGDASQLIVYHFMFHPEWDAGCKSCSFWADTYDGSVEHLAARDVSLVAISRAPLDLLLAYRERMGWRFPWASSATSSFNYDFGVSFSPRQIAAGTADYNYEDGNAAIEELPGISVFTLDGDSVFHTYSTYARGLDPYNATYQLLDIVPKGRNEDDLTYPQEWVKRRDEY